MREIVLYTIDCSCAVALGGAQVHCVRFVLGSVQKVRCGAAHLHCATHCGALHCVLHCALCVCCAVAQFIVQATLECACVYKVVFAAP